MRWSLYLRQKQNIAHMRKSQELSCGRRTRGTKKVASAFGCRCMAEVTLPVASKIFPVKRKRVLTWFEYKLYSYQGCCQVSVNITFRPFETRQASVNKKDIAPVNAQILPIKEKDTDVVAVIDSMRLEARRPECYWEKLGWAAKAAGIDPSWGAEERTSISPVRCKG